ncbi:MAG: hypothetical protein ACRD2A_09215 [Vicinamibacterales bacterium]
MRSPRKMTVDWIGGVMVLLVLAIVVVLTLPLWMPDLFGHFWH